MRGFKHIGYKKVLTNVRSAEWADWLEIYILKYD
jgi:hypothetical protein